MNLEITYWFLPQEAISKSRNWESRDGKQRTGNDFLKVKGELNKRGNLQNGESLK